MGADRSNPDRHQLVLSVGGISLPDRDYYLRDTEEFQEVRSAYVDHITEILELASIEDANEKARGILNLETAIAENLWPRNQRRNRDLTYNPMTFTEFKNSYSENSPLERELQICKRLVKTLVWINPMYGASTFEVRAAALKTAMPYIDHF